ncbi:MAG: PUA domain-containing protein [Promethearchaeota archaeon]
MVFNPLSHNQLFDFLFGTFSFQFSDEIAKVLLADYSLMTFKYSRLTKKIKFIYFNNVIFASYKPQLGKFSLGLEAAEKIVSNISSPQQRVIVSNDVQDFIKDGRSVFAKHVVSLDSTLHIGDDVIVVNEDDELLAVGKLSLPPRYIMQKMDGSCVKVRKGVNSRKEVLTQK